MGDYTDIIVVGSGPVGLTFARQFKDSSLKVSVIEKSPLETIENPPFDGREVALTHFTKNYLQDSGIWALIPEDKIYPLKQAKIINGNSDYQLYFQQPTQARGQPIDRLGFLVSNCDVRKACYKSVKDLSNIDLINGVTVEDVQINEQEVTTQLSNGKKLNAQLLVCADGRFSSIRQKIGIPVDTHQFGRTVICFRMKHELSNEHTAFECFHYGRTLAILPLEKNLSSIVITIDTNLADNIINMTPEELAQDIYRETKGKLGYLTQVSEKNSYSLVGVHARRFYDQRCALIGDAAVGMHPVTAHGFNLGIESVAHLSGLILEANYRGKNIARETLLERYNLKHQTKTRVLYHGTNFVVKLFTNEAVPAKFLRNALLRISNHVDPIKQLISKQLTS
ncbi:MAG: 5-demethoxyubiquinol-8 5-hydroxylase UbiM [Neisseriaceae bacterium]|nr:MAG: 5-demethoxyubiquinol-8 5-hydroxylase UbiM [Neisseriaceae bacterium]